MTNLSQHILIETFLYCPTESLFVAIEKKKQAKRLLMKQEESSARMHFLWSSTKNNYSKFDIIKQSIVDSNSRVFFLMMETIKDERYGVLHGEILLLCAKYDREKEAFYVVNELQFNNLWGYYIQAAAKGGNRNIVDLFVKHYVDEEDSLDWYIACGAAEGGHKELLVEYAYYCVDDYAIKAAKGGHREIVYVMIDRGAFSYSLIARYAARTGDKELFDDMIRRGPGNWNSLAWSAAKGGQVEILNEMIGKGVTSWSEIALHAAKGGHLNIVKDMLDKHKVSTDYIQHIAEAAAKYGYLHIIKYLNLCYLNIVDIIDVAASYRNREIVDYLYDIMRKNTYKENMID